MVLVYMGRKVEALVFFLFEELCVTVKKRDSRSAVILTLSCFNDTLLQGQRCNHSCFQQFRVSIDSRSKVAYGHVNNLVIEPLIRQQAGEIILWTSDP